MFHVIGPNRTYKSDELPPCPLWNARHTHATRYVGNVLDMVPSANDWVRSMFQLKALQSQVSVPQYSPKS